LILFIHVPELFPSKVAKEPKPTQEDSEKPKAEKKPAAKKAPAKK
jgi:hypothetical protein